MRYDGVTRPTVRCMTADGEGGGCSGVRVVRQDEGLSLLSLCLPSTTASWNGTQRAARRLAHAHAINILFSTDDRPRVALSQGGAHSACSGSCRSALEGVEGQAAHSSRHAVG